MYDVHVNDLHHRGRSGLTWKFCKQQYHNITEKLVKIFISYCATCNTTKMKNLLHKGATKPIETFQYRDHSQCELIDFWQDPQPLYPGDPKSPICHWLMVVKDHFTCILYACPLICKKACHVVAKLNNYYCYTGYPVIFHTDNGNEFKQEVFSCLKQLNQKCYTVMGSVRNPWHQGSVERANGAIKPIIIKTVQHQRSLQKIMTWNHWLLGHLSMQKQLLLLILHVQKDIIW